MKTETKKQKNKPKTKSLTFYSNCCKKVGRVFVENWEKGSDGPFEIEFIYHEEMVAMVHSVIKIKEGNNNEVIAYAFCGDCGSLISPAFETELIREKIKPPINRENI